MGRTTFTDIPSGRPSIFLVLAILATIAPARSLNPWPRDSSTCPRSYRQCSSPNLPSDFCCPSSSTCIGLDNASSVICCPKGQDCSYIKPITCDASLQDPALFPKNPVKTSKLNHKLPKCGSSCCPFGYTCVGGSTCAREKESSTATTDTISTTSPSTTSSATDQFTTTPTTLPATTTTTTSITTTQSPTTNPLAALNCTAKDQQHQQQSCASFPSKAVVAGFFPGALFGALLVLLIRFCLRKRQNPSLAFPPSHKTSHYTTGSSDRTIVHISDPIPSHESSYRTDFLLRSGRDNNSSRSDAGIGRSRSVLQRTGTRVKGLFSSSASASASASTSSTPRLNNSHPHSRTHNHPYTYHDNTPVPPLPLTPPSQIRVPPKQRRPSSTESIRVYSPAGAGAGVCAGSLNPGCDDQGSERQDDPRACGMDGRSRPDTAFQQMIDRVGFQDSRGDPCFRVDRGVGTGRGGGRGR